MKFRGSTLGSVIHQTLPSLASLDQEGSGNQTIYHLHPFYSVLFKLKDLVAKQHLTNTSTDDPKVLEYPLYSVECVQVVGGGGTYVKCKTQQREVW